MKKLLKGVKNSFLNYDVYRRSYDTIHVVRIKTIQCKIKVSQGTYKLKETLK